MLNHTEYLTEALEEIRKTANVKLKLSRKVHRKAARQVARGYWATGERMQNYADRLDREARSDLAQIQKILANPNMNR